MPRDWYGPQPGIRRGDAFAKVKVRWIEPTGKSRICDYGNGHAVLDVVDTADEREAMDRIGRNLGIERLCSMALYSIPGDPARFTLSEAPAGSLWHMEWYPKEWGWGDDGLCLGVCLPNRRHWHIDGRASNCDSKCAKCNKPYHDATHKTDACIFTESRPHKCWVRHGNPKTGDIHVDKNGVTCGAGAGSIQAGNYHGFLHNGYLSVSG